MVFVIYASHHQYHAFTARAIDDETDAWFSCSWSQLCILLQQNFGGTISSSEKNLLRNAYYFALKLLRFY